jgi:S1-C subfamily serine protease
VIVDPSGYVVTWQHLVQEADAADDKSLFVQLNDAENTRLPAAIVRADDATGLALLHVQPPAAGLQFLELGPDRPRPGGVAIAASRSRSRGRRART